MSQKRSYKQYPPEFNAGNTTGNTDIHHQRATQGQHGHPSLKGILKTAEWPVINADQV